MRPRSASSDDHPEITTAAMREERDDEQHPRHRHGPRQSAQVHGHDPDHGGHADGLGLLGPQVGADRQRHRHARGRLADDETPAGEVAPGRPESVPGVDVGAATLGVDGGQLGRGGRVAERHHPGDRQPDEQTGAGGLGGWSPCDEHAGADHRSGADHHGIGEAQMPRAGLPGSPWSTPYDCRDGHPSTTRWPARDGAMNTELGRSGAPGAAQLGRRRCPRSPSAHAPTTVARWFAEYGHPWCGCDPMARRNRCCRRPHEGTR